MIFICDAVRTFFVSSRSGILFSVYISMAIDMLIARLFFFATFSPTFAKKKNKESQTMLKNGNEHLNGNEARKKRAHTKVGCARDH